MVFFNLRQLPKRSANHVGQQAGEKWPWFEWFARRRRQATTGGGGQLSHGIGMILSTFIQLVFSRTECNIYLPCYLMLHVITFILSYYHIYSVTLLHLLYPIITTFIMSHII
jgi:hypothetical protein